MAIPPGTLTLLYPRDRDDKEERQHRRERCDGRQPRNEGDTHHEQKVKVGNSAELLEQIPRQKRKECVPAKRFRESFI